MEEGSTGETKTGRGNVETGTLGIEQISLLGFPRDDNSLIVSKQIEIIRGTHK